MPSKKIVLYSPLQLDPERGYYLSADTLPLEMLQIASLPDREGYEVVIIDANLLSEAEAHRRAVEEAEDALVFGTTAILGYMVWDGHLAAMKVRQAHPHLAIIAGGWFPSCLPEYYLQTGVYNAVCIGQGELTFFDFVRAVECGASLHDIPGLALWSGGEVVHTPRRPIVGWDVLPRTPWHLIDPEPYRERQLRPGAQHARNRYPAPPSVRRRGENNFFGITYFSSFGCPEPCAFCCSPELTERRWKAMSAEQMLDDIEELHERWGFEVVRFQDANFGVDKKRTRAFAEGLLERGLRIVWTGTFETFSILRYGPELMDLARESGLYLAAVGAEAATDEMMQRIGKPIKPGDNLQAARMLHERGIIGSYTYIIGYPNEEADSMLATLDQARSVLAECPSVSAHVYPFRPIPGNPMYREALGLGYVPPTDLEGWGRMLEYHVMDTWKDNIPPAVERVWRRYYQYASFFHGLVRREDGWMERLARWRISRGEYRLPVDLKAFYLLDKVFGWSAYKGDERQQWVMTPETDPIAVSG